MKKIIVAICVLTSALGMTINSYAAGDYACPLPSQIVAFNVAPNEGIQAFMLLAPAMSTSDGGGFGVMFGTNSTVGNLVDVTPTTVTVNGQPRPGYNCQYYASGNVSATSAKQKIEQFPEKFRPIAEKLINQGSYITYGSVIYVAK